MPNPESAPVLQRERHGDASTAANLYATLTGLDPQRCIPPRPDRETTRDARYYLPRVIVPGHLKDVVVANPLPPHPAKADTELLPLVQTGETAPTAGRHRVADTLHQPLSLPQRIALRVGSTVCLSAGIMLLVEACSSSAQ